MLHAVLAPRWTEPDNPVLAAAREVVARREVDAVLVTWPSFNAAMKGDRQGPVSIYFDSVRPDSLTARNRVERAVIRVPTLGCETIRPLAESVLMASR